MEVSQGHNSVPTQPIEFKLGRIDVFVEFYRSIHKTNCETNFLKLRFGKTNLPKTAQNTVTIGPIDLKLGRSDVREQY